jgi:hypothetical protein
MLTNLLFFNLKKRVKHVLKDLVINIGLSNVFFICHKILNKLTKVILFIYYELTSYKHIYPQFKNFICCI